MSSTSLHIAVKDGKTESVAALLSSKVEVNAKDEDGRTPLHLAAIQGRTDLAELLLRKGGKVSAVDNKGERPLHYAAFMGHLDMVRLLLANHTYVEAKDKDGETALNLASAEGHDDVVDMLQTFKLQQLCRPAYVILLIVGILGLATVAQSDMGGNHLGLVLALAVLSVLLIASASWVFAEKSTRTMTALGCAAGLMYISEIAVMISEPKEPPLFGIGGVGGVACLITVPIWVVRCFLLAYRLRQAP